MNTKMIERNCADCLLRMMDTMERGEGQAQVEHTDAESALEGQLEQLERSFGANWKWS